MSASDDRIKKTVTGADRENRGTADESRKSPEAMNVSSEELRKLFRENWTQQALPDPPAIPGWHTCWLSTTNVYDTIDRRMKLGYVRVTPEESGLSDSMRLKEGQFAGFISCNEMLLFKIPMASFQEAMQIFHHEAPAENAASIRRKIEEVQFQDNDGRKLGSIDEGMRNMADDRKPTPTFIG
jgi:hypothetical protein